jgi:hypothetical protein
MVQALFFLVNCACFSRVRGYQISKGIEIAKAITGTIAKKKRIPNRAWVVCSASGT